MRMDIDVQLDFYCAICGSHLDNNISYDNLRSVIRVEPCEKCLEEAREEAREKAIKEAREE